MNQISMEAKKAKKRKRGKKAFLPFFAFFASPIALQKTNLQRNCGAL
jgi:hypothetical protein